MKPFKQKPKQIKKSSQLIFEQKPLSLLSFLAIKLVPSLLFKPFSCCCNIFCRCFCVLRVLLKRLSACIKDFLTSEIVLPSQNTKKLLVQAKSFQPAA